MLDYYCSRETQKSLRTVSGRLGPPDPRLVKVGGGGGDETPQPLFVSGSSTLYSLRVEEVNESTTLLCVHINGDWGGRPSFRMDLDPLSVHTTTLVKCLGSSLETRR